MTRGHSTGEHLGTAGSYPTGDEDPYTDHLLDVAEDSLRPWCCPEPRCTPLLQLTDGDNRMAAPRVGFSFVCFGLMAEPVAFTYDGVEHLNDLNDCHYSPLKGLIRWQENEADWNVLASYYRLAGDAAREAKASR